MNIPMYVYLYVHVYVNICVRVCMRVRVCVCVCAHARVFACVFRFAVRLHTRELMCVRGCACATTFQNSTPSLFLWPRAHHNCAVQEICKIMVSGFRLVTDMLSVFEARLCIKSFTLFLWLLGCRGGLRDFGGFKACSVMFEARCDVKTSLHSIGN